MRASELACACPELYVKVMENLESYISNTYDADIDGLDEFIESEFNSEDHCYYHIWYEDYIHNKISYTTMFEITKAIQTYLKEQFGDEIVLSNIVKLFNLYFLFCAYELRSDMIEKYNLNL